jgi:hypothetical protein
MKWPSGLWTETDVPQACVEGTQRASNRMNTKCGSCGADPGVTFSFCPFCGAARVADDAAVDHQAPQPPRNAFDRAVTFYQPVDPVVPVTAERPERPEPAPAIVKRGQAPGPAPGLVGFGDAAPTMRVGSQRAPEAEAPTALAYLVEWRGAHPGSVHRLLGEVVVGRGDEADITIADPAISKRHARIRCDNGSFMFEDLGTTNVSLLLAPDGDRSRIIGAKELEDGDTLVLGETNLRVLIVESSEGRG